MKVLLEKDVWIADWKGDPGRTLKKENAKEFSSMMVLRYGCNQGRRKTSKNYKRIVSKRENKKGDSL